MQKRKVYKKRRAAKKGKGHKERPGSQKRKGTQKKKRPAHAMLLGVIVGATINSYIIINYYINSLLD